MRSTKLITNDTQCTVLTSLGHGYVSDIKNVIDNCDPVEIHEISYHAEGDHVIVTIK